MKKVALVTGASRGLGFEIARGLREKGFEVLTPTRGQMDMTSCISISVYARAIERLDLLVNCAAVVSDMRESMAVNAMGAFYLTDELWRFLIKSRGRVVNISSREGLPASFGNRPYSISKATLNAITRMLAARGLVTVSTCCPGWFRSRLGGEDAPASAAEAADTPLWLATEAEESNGKFYINRQVVPW